MVQDGHTFLLTKVAHITGVSEGEVVIEASLAGPISNSLCWLLWVRIGSCAVFVSICKLVHDNLFHDLTLLLVAVDLRLEHMLWFAVGVIRWLGLLASVALLSALEVIVLAFVALPASIWEVKTSSVLCLACFAGVVFVRVCLPAKVYLGMELVSLRSEVIDDDVVDSLWEELLGLHWILCWIELLITLITVVLGPRKHFLWSTAGWRIFIATWRTSGDLRWMDIHVLEIFDEVVDGVSVAVLSSWGGFNNSLVQVEVLDSHNLLKGAFFIELALHFCWTFIDLA